MKNQPVWLRSMVSGNARPDLFSVFMENETHAILRCEGHSFTSGRAQSSYAPVSYTLVRKDDHAMRGQRIWSGRLSNGARVKLQLALERRSE